MISQSSIDNNELDKKYLDSLIALFKSRNNLKYPVDSPEFKIIDTLPAFDRNQINIFSNKIKSKEDVKDALISIGFQNNYKFNALQLKEIQNQCPPDISIILTYYQILARIYFHEKLTSEDFSLIMEVLIALIQKANKEFISSSFYILYLNAQLSHMIWSEKCVLNVLLFFEKNNFLSSHFYNILVHYLSLFVQANEEDKQTIRILKMLQQVFKSNYPIVNVPDLSKIVDLIHPLLFNFNSDSLLVFAYISKIDKESTEKDIRIFPEFFTTLALKNADIQNMNITVSQQERIHDLPAVYTGHTPDLDYEIKNIDTFHNTFYPVPSELYKRNNQLGNLIPESTRSIIRSSLRDFFEVLDPKLTKIFFQEMNKALLNCMRSNDYNGFAAYLYLLHYSLTNNTKTTALSKQYLDENIPYFFPKSKLSNPSTKQDSQISFGDMFYNPENTIFGPLALDPVINIFRTSILFLTTSTNLYKFIESMKGCPFLMAEQISRLCLRFDAEIFSTFNKSSEQIFRTISREMVVLQMKDAPVPPRNAFFIFFIHFLTDEKKVGDCLKSTIFVDSIFRYIFETGVMNQLIIMISRSFLLLNNDTYFKVNIEPSVAFLYNAAKRNEEIAPRIYRMVSEIVKYRPIFISKFDRFLDLMMDELQKKNTKESFDNAITLLELVASYHNSNNNDSDSFKFFGPKYFRIIASHVNFASYQKLFNLMIGGYNLDTKGIFLIRQPPFIPLLFIAYANDYQKINRIIELFLLLATRSELNCRALHDGDVDMILLKHLNKENPLKYKGFVIPPLKINEKIENTTVLNLLSMIISAKSNFAIAKKIMEIIIKGQNLTISKLTNNILASTTNVPTPSYPIGSLNHFCSITGLTDRAFKGDISLTFWMKTDPTPLSHTTAVVYLVSIIDKNDSTFNIILQNNLLFASYETRNKKTSVCLCQRMNPNTWTHFAITFSNTPTQKPLISTFKNFERLHDSEFCYLEFAPGPLEIQFGGYDYHDRADIYPNMQYGSLSRIFIYNRYISTDEIILIMEGRDKMPRDFVASSILSYNSEKSLSTNFIMNHYVVESLKNCLSNEQVVNNFIESLRTLTSRPLIDQIFSILYKIISFSKNKTISSRLAAILLNSDYPDHRLYKTIESIVFKIADKDVQRCWIEDVLINVPIWSRCDSFDAVLQDYSKLLINNPQFFKKSYFVYFLNQFNILVNTEKGKRDENALREFMIFIERYPIPRENNETNIEKDAVNNLICFATNASDEDKVIFLEIIEKIADSINQVSYNEYEYIFYFVAMNNIDIATHAILAVHQLFTKSFHAIVYSILDALTISLSELFTRLEPYVKRYRNLFSLTCAIGLQTGQKPSQFPFNMTPSSCWFVFPLLSAMVVHDNTPYIDLIARNAVKSKDINLIIFMTTYLNLFAEQETQGKTSNNILQSILLALYRNHRAESNPDRKYQIFFHLFAASFFKINAPLMNDEIASLIQPKPESPKSIQKIKVINFETFNQMAKNAEAFINEMEKPKMELKTKYLEMKKKREALLAQAAENQTAPQDDLKLDDEDFIHLESIIDSVKSYKLHYSFKKEDLDLLKSAYTIFTHYLKNYTIEGIQSESSGTFFKTKVPAFGFDDLRQLMAKFIRIYQNVSNSNNNSKSNDEFYERRLSLDSSSSNQQNSSAFKTTSQLDNESGASSIDISVTNSEETNLRLSRDEDNLSEMSHLSKAPIQPSSSSPSTISQFSNSTSQLNSSSPQLIQASPLVSPTKENPEQQLNLHPIGPHEKQIKIFDYFADNLNSYLNCVNFNKILATIRPQREFKKKIGPINRDICANLIQSEEERLKRLKIITEKTVKFVRSSVIGYSMTPYLMKRQKTVQTVNRFKPVMPAFTSPNAQLIKFDEKNDVYFEVPFSAELNEQLQQQKQQQLQQQQNQNSINKKPASSQPTRLSHLIRLSATSSNNINSPNMFTNENEYIIQTKKRKICIDKSKIINIYWVDNMTIEIIDNQSQPYLIHFNNQEGATLCRSRIKIDKRCKFSISEEYNKNLINIKGDGWIKGYYSTFHFLSILNFLNGKNYENSAKYPFFPSLAPMNKITNKDPPSLKPTFFPMKNKEKSNDNDSSVQFENRLYVLPELYYLFESDTIENVYQRRKLLEEVSKTDRQGKDSRLLKWIEVVFNSSPFQRQINKKRFEIRQIFLEMDTESKIIYAAPFYRDSSFLIVLSSGEFSFFSVQITEKIQQVENIRGKKKMNEIINDINIEINNISPLKKFQLDKSELHSLKFAPLNVGYIPDITALLNKNIKFGFIAYNNNTIHFVDLNGKVTKENVYLENPIFHNAVVLSTPSTISPISSLLALQNRIPQKNTKPINNNANINNHDYLENSVLCNIHAKVTCLQSSVVFGIIAFGSDDCKIRIRSLNDGKKIATAELDESEVPTMILITESWGFVVVYCVTKIYIFSVNGKFVQKCDKFHSFNQWFTFKSADDFDYVAIVNDHESKLEYFEVMYPDKVKEVMLNGKIITMRYEPKFSCFIFLADNGKLTVMPADI